LRLARPGGQGTPLQGCPKTARSNSAYDSRSEPEIPYPIVLEYRMTELEEELDKRGQGDKVTR
jgi:hypothetical protein